MANRTAVSKRSDLGTRLASALVMVVIAGGALYLGGAVLTVFVAMAGLLLLWEWWSLVRRFARSPAGRLCWLTGGVIYIAGACVSLILMPASLRWVVVIAVIAVDTGAYFAGRRFGGRKIAPSISPSKTWAGLYGGMTGSALILLGSTLFFLSALSALGSKPSTLGSIVKHYPAALLGAVLAGCVAAVLAQAGDFFESWMKRRAGVKDSGTLIPGHGGLLDRVDGLIPVAIAAGVLSSVLL